MDAKSFSKLLRVEEYVKCPVATQTLEGVGNTCQDIDILKKDVADLDNEVRKVISKYSNAPFLGNSKLPPGSGNAIISFSYPRYLMNRLHTLRAQLHLLYGELHEAIAELRMAAAHCVRSAEACELLGSTLLLSASGADDLAEAERWLLRAVDAGKHLEEQLQSQELVRVMTPEGMYDEQRRAAEKRAAENAGHRYLLLLCQTHRCDVADEILLSLGYRFRLSEELLNYFLSVERNVSLRAASLQYAANTIVPTMAVCDNALSPPLLAAMRRVFEPGSSFWRQHFYDPLQSLSRSVGFFSYVYPFRERRSLSIQEQVIDRIREMAVDMGIDLSAANYAEWWVHSRVHGAGHQLHYDSDEKHIARGGAPKHPLFSTVVYLCDDAGGPTCITDQKLGGSRGTQAWICMPKMNRLVFFDATYLHGVLPGVGAVPNSRRLSFMIGWWPAISSSILTGAKPGAAHCYPPTADTILLSTSTVTTTTGTVAGGASVTEEPWFASHGPLADISYPQGETPVACNIAADVVLSVPSLWTPISDNHHLEKGNGDEMDGDGSRMNVVTEETVPNVHDADYDLLFQGF
jgi:hypothetical protein